MKAKTLATISMLLDMKEASLELLGKNHRNPALLSIYTFIDICASLANNGKTQNQDIFKSYLENFASLSKWNRYTSYDLWAARSSLLHTYSPLGNHTNKSKNPAQIIFYYSWPEKKEDMQLLLELRGYKNFLLLDINEIKRIATDSFNTMYNKIESDPDFEDLFLYNSKNFLPSCFYLRLEDALSFVDNF